MDLKDFAKEEVKFLVASILWEFRAETRPGYPKVKGLLLFQAMEKLFHQRFLKVSEPRIRMACKEA